MSTPRTLDEKLLLTAVIAVAVVIIGFIGLAFWDAVWSIHHRHVIEASKERP